MHSVCHYYHDFFQEKFSEKHKNNTVIHNLVCKVTRSKPTALAEDEHSLVNPFSNVPTHPSSHQENLHPFCQMTIDPPPLVVGVS